VFDYNVGQKIKELRIENDLTQEELAIKVNVCRQAVSRWETGKSIPDYDQMVSLSKVFNLTIDELLFGKNYTNSKVARYFLNLLYEKNKYKRLINKIVILIVIVIVFLILYYFLSTYNKISVYEIYTDDNDIACTKSILVRTTGSSYFNGCTLKSELANITFSDDAFYEYYYIYNGERRVVIGTGHPDVLVYDDAVYKEYFDYNHIDEILNNFYLEITDGDKMYTLKLKAKKTFTNSKLVNPFDNRKV
jgi:transcriptional regulator with XRE-family HTH domain